MTPEEIERETLFLNQSGTLTIDEAENMNRLFSLTLWNYKMYLSALDFMAKLVKFNNQLGSRVAKAGLQNDSDLKDKLESLNRLQMSIAERLLKIEAFFRSVDRSEEGWEEKAFIIN